MNWVLLTVLVSIGVVAGDGAWKQNQLYKYRIHAYTTNNHGKLKVDAVLRIYPQSDYLFIGEISQALAYREPANEQFHLPSWNKQFLIHLEDGVIHSISVESSMTDDQINQLKAIVSQFQIDTNARNLLQSADNHLPEEDNANAFYKTMEPTFFGNCETLYDISPLPEYLVEAHPEWVPLPQLKEGGDFIKIEKTSNLNNCKERSSYRSYHKKGQNDFRSRTYSYSKSDGSTEQRTSHTNERTSLVTRVILSGDLQNYVIQSSTARYAEGFHHNLNVILESVEEGNIRPKFRLESFVNAGSLVYKNKSSMADIGRPTDYSEGSDRDSTEEDSTYSPNIGREVTGLQKSSEDELGISKDRYKGLLDEMDATFAELAGY